MSRLLSPEEMLSIIQKHRGCDEIMADHLLIRDSQDKKTREWIISKLPEMGEEEIKEVIIKLGYNEVWQSNLEIARETIQDYRNKLIKELRGDDEKDN